MHEFISIKSRCFFFKLIDLIYKVNLIWISFFVFMMFFVAIPKEIAESGVTTALLNVENSINIFLLYWFFRYWFRLRGSPLDAILAVLPIQVIVYALNVTSTSSNLFFITHGLILISIFLLAYFLLKIKWLHRRNVKWKDIFSILSGIFNPFLFLAFPFYVLITILSLGIINSAITNQYYGGLFFLLLIPYLLKPVKKLANPSAKLLLKIDPRPCILYLRSFVLDAKVIGNADKYSLLPKKSIEEILSQITSRIGPFVAIADPKSTLQSIGAAKTKYGEHEWQSVVHDYTLKSKFIIMLAGDTTAIDWELQKIKAESKEMDLLILFGEPVTDKLGIIMDQSEIQLSGVKYGLGEEIIGAFKKNNNVLMFFLGNPNDKYSYEAALHYFLAERSY